MMKKNSYYFRTFTRFVITVLIVAMLSTELVPISTFAVGTDLIAGADVAAPDRVAGPTGSTAAPSTKPPSTKPASTQPAATQAPASTTPSPAPNKPQPPSPKDPTQASEPSDEEKKQKVDDELYKWAKSQEENRKEAQKKEKLEKAEQAINLINESGPAVFDMVWDMFDGGGFDTATAIGTIVDAACGVLAFFAPWGTVVSAGLKLAKTILMKVLGGVDGPSETQLMEDRLTQRIDAIADQICEVQDQLSELSDQVAEATEKIIAAIPTALENETDKNRMTDFMLSSGTGDFSYNQLRNYIYGSTTDNRNANTAYYALVTQAQLNGASSEEIKYYYDQLYSSLMDGRASFHDYIIGDQFGKSIVASYYDLIKTRPDLTSEMGMSPEIAAIEFAYDLYQTELMMDQIILICNNYQYMYMLARGETSYDYGTGVVYASDIYNSMGQSNIAAMLYTGLDDIQIQFAKDAVYILDTAGTFTVYEDGAYDYRATREDEGSVYADVTTGNTVYFNRISDVICNYFDLDAEDFVYSGRGMVDEEGVFEITNATIGQTVLLQYRAPDGTTYTLDSITFADATYSEFVGGKGTPSDPYLIGTADQFMNIGDDLTASYKLVCDIDMNGKTMNPFGFAFNGADSQTFEEFTGNLQGNGHTVSNLNISGATNTGVFGIIGETGDVRNVNFNNITVTTNINYTNGSTTTYTGGVVAGINNGNIVSCKVSNTEFTVTSNTTNEDAERNVYFKYGGLVGINKGEMYAVKLDSTKITVSSSHTFGGASVDNNKNMIYVGGISGTCPGKITYAHVAKDVELKATVKNTLSPKNTVHSYAQAYVAGITTHEGMDKDKLENHLFGLYSEAETLSASYTIAHKDSRWGKGKKKAKKVTDTLITDIADDKLTGYVTTAEEVAAVFYTTPTYDVSITDSTTAYAAGATKLNEEKMEIIVNGEKQDSFTILNAYGFNTYNASYTSQVKNVEVTVFFLTTIKGETVLLKDSFPITVDKNVPKDITVLDYESNYVKGEKLATTAVLSVTDANGDTQTIFNAPVTVTNAAAATATLGTKNIELNYNGVTAEVEIEVLCNIHMSYYDYDNPDHYTSQGTVAATCQAGGYDLYTCNTCGFEVKQNHTPVGDHAVVREISKEATCDAPGVMGKIYCSTCNTVFQEQTVIPQKAHQVVNNGNDTTHQCTLCNKAYAHEYVVSESILDGQLTYTYTCVTCGYVGKKNDTNIITYEERLRPAVVVSNGYASAPGDLVTVYVDLENNPGVNGANFGIRYSEDLELVGCYEGTFFQDTLGASNPVSCGYNFSWGAEATRDAESGNLLRLVFRIPLDAKPDDEYTVSVVYSTVANSEGGFSLPANLCAQLQISSSIPQKFLTKDGTIRIVDRLPGDVNNDTMVNLMDALYLSNCLVNEEQYPITDEILEYGDVNLVAGITINDVTKLLQSISGGYGASLLSPNYHIRLNTNGYNQFQPSALAVQLYGMNNTYADLALVDAAMQQREGYKFLGWYTRLEGGEKISNYHNLVKFDEDQKIQTLYAHWERNCVSFDMNGATSNAITTETYNGNGEQWITLPTPEEKYTVTFMDPTNPESHVKKTMTHNFAYWLGSDGVRYYAGEKFDIHRVNMGSFTLTAVWGDWVLDFPAMEKPGYDATQITWYTRNINGLLDDPLGENPCETIKAMQDKVLYGKWTKPITYTIVYDGNGATSGSVPASTHNYGVIATFNGNVNPGFVRNPVITFDHQYDGIVEQLQTNYIFGGWSKQAANGQVIYELPIKDQPTTEGQSVTLYAYWIGQSVLLPKPNDRTGKSFSGWYDANGNLVGYAGTNYMPASDITLYAKWTDTKYTIILDANGGSVSPSIIDNIIYGKPYGSLPTPTRYGHNFAGWKISGTSTMVDGSTNVPLARDHTLEAQWTTNVISFNANGGTCSTTSVQLDANCKYANLPTPTRTDYAFVGWYYGNTKVTNGTATSVDGNHTLTAKWTPTVATISFRANQDSQYKKITDDDGVYDEIFPGFDRETLKSLGYTKVRVTVSYNVAEIDKGYQELWLRGYENTQVGYNEIEHGGSKKETAWGNHVYQTTFDIKYVNTDGSFYMEWGANGDSGDDWKLGHTIVKVEIIK